MICHAASGRCCEGGVNAGWLEEIERLELELKAANLVDAEETLGPLAS